MGPTALEVRGLIDATYLPSSPFPAQSTSGGTGAVGPYILALSLLKSRGWVVFMHQTRALGREISLAHFDSEGRRGYINLLAYPQSSTSRLSQSQEGRK